MFQHSNTPTLGALAALAVAIVTFIPQFTLWVSRGTEWQGAYAFVDPDELAYAAYLNAVVEGDPRNQNPDLRKQSELDPKKKETIFSIQFFPPLIIAPFARFLGLSTSTLFILLVPAFASFSAIALFWLFLQLTDNAKLSALGVIIVLLCGALASVNPLTAQNTYAAFSFLRRYIPAVPFPAFLLFIAFTWRAFKWQGRNGMWWAAGAGVAFSVLVFSYFFLWTTAAVWFICLTLVWVVARPADRNHVIKCASICGLVMVTALAPFFWLLSHRSSTTDQDQLLVLTHAPDLLRITEILGALLACSIAYGLYKKMFKWQEPPILFAISIAVVPFVILNQQIVTGRSLQPFHYEQFSLNYLILIGAVLIDQKLKGLLVRHGGFSLAVAIMIGIILSAKTSRENLEENFIRDRAIPVFTKLDQDFKGNVARGAALFDETLLAASAPASCSVPVLWSPYTYTYGTIDAAEDNQRLFQYFYFLGVDEQRFETIITNGPLYQAALFGLSRVNPALTPKFNPITREDIGTQVRAYGEYRRVFSKKDAARWPLSFVILSDELAYDLTNLDRWYMRDEAERFKGSLLYRVRLRSSDQDRATEPTSARQSSTCTTPAKDQEPENKPRSTKLVSLGYTNENRKHRSLRAHQRDQRQQYWRMCHRQTQLSSKSRVVCTVYQGSS